MRKSITTFLAAIALIVPAAAANAAPEVGKAAPDFSATDIEGNPFKLSDHKGDIVVLEWTNHECPFVVKHYGTNNMQALQKSETAKGVKWISINSSAEGRQGFTTADEAKKVAMEQGAAATAIITDPSGEIGKLYDARTTPHMYVIDAEGTLAYAGAIDDNSSPNPKTVEGANNYVVAAVDSLIAGEEVATKQTQPYGCSVKYAR